jgi:hypothetical protein
LAGDVEIFHENWVSLIRLTVDFVFSRV